MYLKCSIFELMECSRNSNSLYQFYDYFHVYIRCSNSDFKKIGTPSKSLKSPKYLFLVRICLLKTPKLRLTDILKICSESEPHNVWLCLVISGFLYQFLILQIFLNTKIWLNWLPSLNSFQCPFANILWTEWFVCVLTSNVWILPLYSSICSRCCF